MERDDDFVVLRPRAGLPGSNLSLSALPAEPTEPPRLHLNLYSSGQAADVERLLALGATRWDEPNRPADVDYVILLDPEGNRFCVVDASDRRPITRLFVYSRKRLAIVRACCTPPRPSTRPCATN